MTTLPNPFESGAPAVTAPDEAAAAVRHDDAAATIMESSAAVEQDDVNVLVAGSNPASPATCHIAEIFAGARRLEQEAAPGPFDPDAITLADELLYVTLQAMDNPKARDLPYVPHGLIEELEPMPLFLRKAG